MSVAEYDTPKYRIPKQTNGDKPPLAYAESMGFGDRLKTAREAAGLTGEAVGAQVGVSKATISHWEKGRYEPSIEQIRGLCAVLNVSAAWLFEQEALDLPPDAIEEARVYAALPLEDRRKWKTLRKAMFATPAPVR
jgi:transcriptional regulator with XRE-family HTH domain